jgi:hypothetical protein
MSDSISPEAIPLYPAPLWLWILGVPCLILCCYMEYRDRLHNPNRKTERNTRP